MGMIVDEHDGQWFQWPIGGCGVLISDEWMKTDENCQALWPGFDPSQTLTYLTIGF